MKRRAIRCTALQVSGWLCGRPAKAWVVRGQTSEPRCGNHARAYAVRWPLLTADPEADRAIAEGVFV
jgi:hypothetical protein